MHRIGGGQFQGGEQAIVEGNGHEAIVLLLYLGQQAGGLALQDALDAALGRAAPTAFAGHANQHPIPIPSVVELVVADVDVLFAVVAQGKAEALAAAAQPRLNQPRVTAAADAVVAFFEHPHATEAGEGDAEQVLVARVGEAKRFFELGDRQGLLARELVEQVSDRELHRETGCSGIGPPAGACSAAQGEVRFA